LVDRERPGDFNQSMMELGAVVCTPKSPSCDSCPVKSDCMAVKKDEAIEDIEECGICIKKAEYNKDLGVLNYPRKAKKTASRNEVTLVAVITSHFESVDKYAMVRRPKTGLLANLLEFPSVSLGNEDYQISEETNLLCTLLTSKQLKPKELLKVGPVVHVFSHINMTYVVYKGDLESVCDDTSVTWVSETEFEVAGTSTAMRKVFKSLTSNSGNESKKRKREEFSDSKQPSINTFFQSKVKKEKL